MEAKFFFRGLDWSLILVVFLLTALSLSTILAVAPTEFKKQAVFVLFGFTLIFFGSHIDFRFLKNASLSLYIVMLAVLGAVLVWGASIRGTRSWFGIGAFGLQPVELAKLISIIILAKYLARNYQEIYRLRHLVVSVVFIFIPALLIVLQPDMGSVMVLLLVWLAMIIVAGIRWRYFFTLCLLSFLGGFSGWHWFFKDYQKERLRIFLNPQIDPLGYGYNIIQSIIAIGSGGFLGKGLGYGTQSHLNFLPAKHTDFIFAVIAEEMGFLGIIFVLGFYAFLFWRIYLIAKKAPDNFSRFLSVGIMILFLAHVLINIGMNLGIFPVIGIPLLFLSYGGSNIIVAFLAIGILQNIHKNSASY